MSKVTDRSDALFARAPAFVATLDGPTHVFTRANESYQRVVGAGRPLLGLAAADALPELVAQGFVRVMDDVYTSGIAHVANESPVKLDRGAGLDDAFVYLVHQPTRDASGAVRGIDVFGFDVTAEVVERRRLEAQVAVGQARQDRLRTVLDALPSLVSFVTAEERYGVVNSAYEEWFGLAPRSLEGRTLLDVIGPAAYETLKPFVKRGLSGERFGFEQHGVPYSRGGKRDISVQFVPREDAAGQVQGYVAVLDDITAKRELEAERERLFQAERAARQEADEHREELRALLATAPLGIATWRGPDLILDSANDRYLAALRSTSEILEQPLARVFAHLRADHPLLRIYREVYRTGVPFVDPEYRISLEVDGHRESKVYAFHLTPVRGADGAVVGVMGCLMDVTELVSLRDQVEVERDLAVALRTAAEEATVSKDRFLAHVSHDLRNPLNSILGWSALLRGMKNDPVKIMRAIDIIERNAKSQVQLIEDLLDVSRITSGKLALDLSLVDVRSAIEAGLDAARLEAGSKGVELFVDVEETIGALTLDSERFRQIVWNLASNAVKFTPKGGAVRVTAQRVSSVFRLVVEDNGRGISARFLPHVFETFEQAEAGGQRAGGLGLGLAIVHRLVHLHEGSIHVESEGEGKGARFTVELPIRAAVSSVSMSTLSTELRPLAGVRILVVDDEEDAREVATVILEQAGAEVTAATSAREALAMLRASRPDIIVSDIGMPERDGKMFMRDVRALPESEGGRVPSVALTAFVRTKDRMEALSAGFNNHVAKPVEPDELVLVVAGLLGKTAAFRAAPEE